MLSGIVELPTAFDPVSWHAHEFLFGYLGAVLGGFLLTALPNWTGRPPVAGWRLGVLVVFWLLGRLAVATSLYWSAGITAAADLVFFVMLAVLAMREIVAGRNWRNLVVIIILTILIAANALFHWEAAQGSFVAQGYGFRLGLAAGIMMIAIIGGRIIPAFTRNWLVKRGAHSLPVQMNVFDGFALVALLVGLFAWVVIPERAVTGGVLIGAGAIHAVRLARWKGSKTLSEPLVWVLHAGYGFVPLGAVLLGVGLLAPDTIPVAAAQHLWMAGAIGLMTLAVMTRATLGHAGAELRAGTGTAILYGALGFSVIARVLAGVMPELADALHAVAGVFWIVAFGGFVLIYGPFLLGRVDDPPAKAS